MISWKSFFLRIFFDISITPFSLFEFKLEDTHQAVQQYTVLAKTLLQKFWVQPLF